MSFVPTMESVRAKIARGGALFASDEVVVVLARVAALEAEIKHVLTNGTLGKQSKRRLRAALAAVREEET